MQVWDRNGEDRVEVAPLSADAGEPVIIDTDLEIRASHITAAAVAAAAVTAAVATMAAETAQPAARSGKPEPLSEPLAEPLARAHHPGPLADVAPVTAEVMQRSRFATATDTPPVADKPTVPRDAVGSILTLVALVLAGWASNQLPLPQHGLQPALQHVGLATLPSLPSLRKPGSLPPTAIAMAAAPAAVAVASDDVPAARDQIAELQQEAEERTRQLTERRAAAQARRQREDATAAQREQRRRAAETQLAEARARAERAPQVVEAPVMAAVPDVPPLAEAVRQCSALSLFARESCLWKLCNGKWGKDGCPSYEKNNEGA